MKEDFLHYLWKTGLYTQPLSTLNGNHVEVVFPGEHNTNQGPDFLNAKIKIGQTLWVGNVELHLQASDWEVHKHNTDTAYNNVILHAVAKNNKEVYLANGNVVPTLELKVPEQLYQQYLFLMQTKQWVACESFINNIDDLSLLQWKESLLVERLQSKTENFKRRLVATNNNWEETFYQSLAYNFGFKLNALPFELLAQSLPYTMLSRHRDQPEHVASMIFGQAGLLPKSSNSPYVESLINNYRHFAHKFNLSPIHSSMWKFMRLRPANFPTVRLAQFSQLMLKSQHLFSNVLECTDLDQLRKLLAVTAPQYWDTHYVFDKPAPERRKALGKAAIDNIIINTIIPLLFVYGNQKNTNSQVSKIMDWLCQLPKERNHITKKWEEMGLSLHSAFDSQALIQLKNVYCKTRRCLNCRIGNQVIKHTFNAQQ